jgi:hypothetical protein
MGSDSIDFDFLNYLTTCFYYIIIARHSRFVLVDHPQHLIIRGNNRALPKSIESDPIDFFACQWWATAFCCPPYLAYRHTKKPQVFSLLGMRVQ